MKVIIDEDTCKRNGVSLSTVLAILLVKTGEDVNQLFKDLIEKEVFVESSSLLGKELLVTQRWDDICSNIILSSDTSIPSEERVEALAKRLMEIFPTGRKEGTNTYWRGNIKDTKLKLKKFFKLYGNKFTDEQIVSATERYVSSFNGNYSYMRVLKYFIWKDVRKVDSEGVGYIEEVSDLATMIENEGNDPHREDWTSQLR